MLFCPEAGERPGTCCDSSRSVRAARYSGFISLSVLCCLGRLISFFYKIKKKKTRVTLVLNRVALVWFCSAARFKETLSEAGLFLPFCAAFEILLTFS